MKNEKTKIAQNCVTHEKAATMKNCLTEKEAALYIGMSRSFLRQDRMYRTLKSRTPGPAYLKYGKSIRFKVSDLDAWIKEHRIER